MRKAAGVHVHEREDILYSLRLRPSLSHRLFCVRYYFFFQLLENQSQDEKEMLNFKSTLTFVVCLVARIIES